MKQSLWIVNAFLSILFLIIILFISFSSVKIPPKKSIEPEVVHLKEETVTKMDTSSIYKNDLFGTYQPEVEVTEPIEKFELTMPVPPEVIKPEIPQPDSPQFLEPLALTLTGVIVVDDESNNQAIIMDNKTKKQTNYKINDEIEDAQLARIYKNKIILIRSNGQQEILYLRTDDVKQESPLTEKNWKKIITKVKDNDYLINYEKFADNITSLSEFTNILNLTSAYKDGKDIGLKVGKIETGNVGIELGLQPGDIIQKVNDIVVDNTQSRYEVFKNVCDKKENEIIKVEILRNNKTENINYKLSKEKNILVESETPPEKINEAEIIQEKMKVLKEKHKFAPTYKEIRSQERSKLFKKIADQKNKELKQG